jgi:hypothetical protein
MKYLITELQYNLIKESVFPTEIRRRMTREILSKYITEGEINFPMLCDDFNDEFEYADGVIDFAIDEFLGEIDTNIWDTDYYPDVRDELLRVCRDWFGSDLLNTYLMTCPEEI